MSISILDKIVTKRRERILEEKKSDSLDELRRRVELLKDNSYKPIDFLQGYSDDSPFLIAEIKKASPSKGLIRKDFDARDIAKQYCLSKSVKAMSVLTEKDFFHGAYENLVLAQKGCKDAERSVPLLLKDFVIDEYQLYRGFCEGASAALLIAAILTDEEIKILHRCAQNLHMEILFETHSDEEYKRALNLGMKVIGINNRDLKTFETDIHITAGIIERCGKGAGNIVISESGIHSSEDIAFLQKSGSDGFLIGEHFMRNEDITSAVNNLMSN